MLSRMAPTSDYGIEGTFESSTFQLVVLTVQIYHKRSQQRV